MVARLIKYKLLDDDCKHNLHKQIHKNGMKSSKEIVGYSKYAAPCSKVTTAGHSGMHFGIE
jgi:hypothetical protein